MTLPPSYPDSVADIALSEQAEPGAHVPPWCRATAHRAACLPLDPLSGYLAPPAVGVLGSLPRPPFEPHPLLAAWLDASMATPASTKDAVAAVIENLTDRQCDELAIGHLPRSVLTKLDQVLASSVVAAIVWANYQGAAQHRGSARSYLQHELDIRRRRQGRRPMTQSQRETMAALERAGTKVIVRHDHEAQPFVFAPSPLQAAVWRLQRELDARAERGRIDHRRAVAAYAVLRGHSVPELDRLPEADQQLVASLHADRHAAHLAADLLTHD